MTRTWLRWLPAATVPAVIAAGALAGSLPASAGDPLPAKTPEQVLALIAQHRDASYSGTLEQTSSLGLPALPQSGPGTATADTAWLELLTAPHTARVYRDGADNARIQVMDRLAERDLVRHGNDVWFYNSKDNTAEHAVLPAGAGTRHAPGKDAMPTPDALAAKLLAKLDRSSELTVGPDTEVAGRAAYQLVLKPRSQVTLLESVEISVDGQNGMPLGVEVTSRGQSEPAFSVAFTKLSLDTPDPALFRFSPPAGATVKEIPVPDHKPGAAKDRSGAAAKDHNKMSKEPAKLMKNRAKVTGTGWESVVELPAGAPGSGGPETGAPETSGPGAAASLLARAAVPVAGGRLLSSALVNLLILDDGRVFAGSVPLDRLQAAAAAR